MGLPDSVKAAALEAAIKAKETAEELQTKRELGQAYGELGQKAFALVESGELSAPELDPIAGRIRTLEAQLATPERPVETTTEAETGQPSNE
jgi:hypothetical protein